jgi:hypothetical protein
MEGKNIGEIKEGTFVIRVEPRIYGTRKNMKEDNSYMDKPLFYKTQTMNYLVFDQPLCTQELNFNQKGLNLLSSEWEEGWIEYSEYLNKKGMSYDLIFSTIKNLEGKVVKN